MQTDLISSPHFFDRRETDLGQRDEAASDGGRKSTRIEHWRLHSNANCNVDTHFDSMAITCCMQK